MLRLGVSKSIFVTVFVVVAAGYLAVVRFWLNKIHFKHQKEKEDDNINLMHFSAVHAGDNHDYGATDFYFVGDDDISCGNKVPRIEYSASSESSVTIVAMAGATKRLQPGYLNFLESLQSNKFDDVIIVPPLTESLEILSMTRSNYTAEAVFWQQRLRLFSELVSVLPPDHVVLVCDAYDVLFGQSKAELVSRFHSFNTRPENGVETTRPCEIIFSVEMLCDTVSCRENSDLTSWFRERASPSNPYKYINAGMFVGTVRGLRVFMVCALEYAVSGRDDQASFAMCFREFSERRRQHGHEQVTACLDYESLLFGNLPPLDDLFAQAWISTLPSVSVDRMSQPLIYRRGQLTQSLLGQQRADAVTPVALHFPGLGFRPELWGQRFNPCQQQLRRLYNRLGKQAFGANLKSSFAGDDGDSQVSVPRQHPRLVALSYVSTSVAPELADSGTVLRAIELTIELLLSSLLTRGTTVVPDVVYLCISLSLSLFPHDTASVRRLVARSVKAAAFSAVVGSSSSSSSSSSLSNSSSISSSQKAPDVQVLFSQNDSINHAQSFFRRVLVVEKALVSFSTDVTLIVFENRFVWNDLSLGRLLKSVMNNPKYCYGFQGMVLESLVQGFGVGETRAVKVKSMAHRAEKYSAVDILDLSHGFACRLQLLASAVDTATTDTVLSRRVRQRIVGADVVVREAVSIAALLACSGIPRVQIPGPVLSDASLVPSRIAKFQAIDMPLLLIIQNSKVSSAPFKLIGSDIKSENIFSLQRLDALRISYPPCSPVVTFREIPDVPDAVPFSWKSNYDALSATSPCTGHLFSRVVNNSFFMGVGQFLAEGDSIASANGIFTIRLENGAKLCIYKNTHNPLEQRILIQCISRSSYIEQGQKKHNVFRNVHAVLESRIHYAALAGGEVCLYFGKSPKFGGTVGDSGHNQKVWCTKTRDRIKSQLLVADGLLQCSHEVERSLLSRLYLHVSNNGLVGLFKSDSFPSNLTKAIDRVNSFVCYVGL